MKNTIMFFGLLAVISTVSVSCGPSVHDPVAPPPARVWKMLYDSLPPVISKDIQSPEEWTARRLQIKSRWLQILGTPPAEVPAPFADTLGMVDEGTYIRYSIKLKTETDSYNRAYLNVPKGNGPFPAVVCYHATTENTIDQPAGLADPGTKHFGKILAGRGFAVIMPENHIYDYHQEIEISEADSSKFEARYPNRWWGRISMNTVRFMKVHPQWTGLGKMIWDGMRCVDFLQTFPTVNKDKIGVIGHSLGGKEALFLAAFDERIQCAVSSEGGIGLSFSNWFDPWYFGAQQQRMAGMDNHEVLSLAAPRPFLLIGGDASDGDMSYAYIKHAQPVYELFGKQNMLVLYNHKTGHTVTDDALVYALDWMDLHLK